jgi:dTDP-L-rhamnose 4-epimerase
LQKKEADGRVFNIGTGQPWTILELARTIASRLGKQVSLKPAEQFRAGDVRHCFADISSARAQLGFEPRMLFPSGLENLLPGAVPFGAGSFEKAHDELRERGLVG